MKQMKRIIARNVTTKGSVLIAFVLPWLVSAIWFTLMYSFLADKDKSLGLNWYTALICVPPIAIFALWSKLFISTVKDFAHRPKNIITEEGDGILLRLTKRSEGRYIAYRDIEKATFANEKNRSGDTPNGTLSITLKTGELIETGVILEVEQVCAYLNGMR